MISLVILKEIRDTIISTRFAIAFVLAAVLIILSFYAGLTGFKLDQARYEAAKAQNLRQLDGQTDWINVRSVRAFLPPQPLASLVGGISDDIGSTGEVYGRGEPTTSDSRFNEDPIYAVFRFLDLDFIFGVVLSLFAIVMGYDAICGEKERGTLRLTFANPLPRGIFLAGKVIGILIAAVVPLLLAFSLGLLLLPIMNISLSFAAWARLALILWTGFLYVAVFVMIAVFVSAITQRTSSAFLILLVVWIGSVLIIPRAAVLLAGRSVPVPSIDEIMAQKAHLSSQIFTEQRKKMEGFQSPPGDDMQQSMKAFSSFMDSLANERDQKIADLSQKLDEERTNAQRQQQRLAFGLARVAPTAALHLALTSLAGTSLGLENQFKSGLLEYQKKFGQFLTEKTGMNLGGGAVIMRISNGEDEPKKAIDPNELPVFEFRVESMGEAMASAFLDIGLLALVALLFFAASFAAFLRYDLR